MDAMSASATSPSPAAVTMSAAEALDEICHEMGITPLTTEEAAALPPWTDEEAAAFERTINEVFEQIEASPKLS